MATEAINVKEWLKKAKLTAYFTKFEELEIAVEELLDLSDEELLEFWTETLCAGSKPNILHNKRFIKGINDTKTAMQPKRANDEKTKYKHETETKDTESDEDHDEDDTAEGDNRDSEVITGRQILTNALDEIDGVITKITKYMQETADAQCKQQIDFIEKVFDVFISQLMDKKSRLIDDAKDETIKQKEILQKLQNNIVNYKQRIQESQQINDATLILEKQQQLINDPLFRRIKQFSLPFIKLIIDQNDIMQQINDYGIIKDVSFNTKQRMHEMDNAAMITNTKSIINIQIGGTGNKMGNLFWKTIKDEYALDNDLRKTDDSVYSDIKVYFREISENKYIPRGISCDIEYCAVSHLLNKDNILQSQSRVFEKGNWAQGHYTSGAALLSGDEASLYDDFNNILRKELESCDIVRGIQFQCNIGGGSGGGLSSLCGLKASDNYPDIPQLYFACIPHKYGVPKSYTIPHQPYNVLMAMHFLIEATRFDYHTDFDEYSFESLYKQNDMMCKHITERQCKGKFGNIIILDNAVTDKICRRLSGKNMKSVDFDKMNAIHNLMINDITSLYRFESTKEVCSESDIVSLNTIKSWVGRDDEKRNDDEDEEDDNKKEEQPMQKHRFYQIYTPYYCPLFLTDYQREIDGRLNLKTLSNRISSYSSTRYYEEEPVITDRVEVIFRGNLDSEAIKNKLSNGNFYGLNNKEQMNAQYIVNYIPKPSQFTQTSVVKLVKDNVWMNESLRTILEDARALYKKKEFLDKYKGEGMDEMEFAEAYANCKDMFEDFKNPLEYKDIWTDELNNDEEEDDDEEDDEEEEEDDDESY